MAVLLQACQSSDGNATKNNGPTNAYDGAYEITVSRIWNRTPQNLQDRFYRTEPEELAYLRVLVRDGEFSLQQVSDSSVGNNYEDLRGAFYPGGLADFSMTAGYLKGIGSPYKLRVKGLIGEELRAGKAVELRPNGFNAHFAAHVSIRKA
jgi:hypothetical protein